MATSLKNVDAIDTYANLAAYASTYTQGWIHHKKSSACPIITVNRSVRGIDEDRPRASTEVYHCAEDGDLVKLSSQSLDIAKPVLFDMSVSGSSTVALHNTFYGATGAKEEKVVVEVISDVHGSYRLDASNVHGPVMGDSWFGGCSWTADERFFAYVAQVKTDKPQTYYGSQTITESGTTASSSKYNYLEDWGEKFVGVGALGVFIVDLANQRIHKVGDIDTALWTVAQPCLIQSDTGAGGRYILAYTAFYNLPRKLGLLHCFQRPCSVFFTELTSQLLSPAVPATLQHWKLSEGLKAARSTRCSPLGTRVAFLGSQAGFEEHNGCSELFSAEVVDLLQAIDNTGTSTASPSTSSSPLYRKVVAEVARAPTSAADSGKVFGFPGIYSEALPVRPFSSETSLVMTSQWGSNTAVLAVDLCASAQQGEEVVREVVVGAEGTAAVLDVSNNDVLCVISTPTAPPRIVLHNLVDIGSEYRMSVSTQVNQAVRLLRCNASGKAENRQCGASSAVTLQDNKILGLNWQTFAFSTDNVPFESIVLYPDNKHTKYGARTAGVPVILVPHGGPHSTTTTAYFHAYAFLAYQLGAAVVHVNYRGSPGYGQDSIHSLPGCVGKNDVADMMTALNHALGLRYDASTGTAVAVSASASEQNLAGAELPLLCDASRVAVVGGSHGGFLAGHLIGQFPDTFRACAMRNPVTNIPGEYSVSDIPGKLHIKYYIMYLVFIWFSLVPVFGMAEKPKKQLNKKQENSF